MTGEPNRVRSLPGATLLAPPFLLCHFRTGIYKMWNALFQAAGPLLAIALVLLFCGFVIGAIAGLVQIGYENILWVLGGAQ